MNKHQTKKDDVKHKGETKKSWFPVEISEFSKSQFFVTYRFLCVGMKGQTALEKL